MDNVIILHCPEGFSYVANGPDLLKWNKVVVTLNGKNISRAVACILLASHPDEDERGGLSWMMVDHPNHEIMLVEGAESFTLDDLGAVVEDSFCNPVKCVDGKEYDDE